MDKIVIRGGNRLEGAIQIAGAKNAALPLMCAGILTDEVLTLENLPLLADIDTMQNLLVQHGVVDHAARRRERTPNADLRPVDAGSRIQLGAL